MTLQTRSMGQIFLVLILSVLFLGGCGEQAKIDEQIQASTLAAETKLDRLARDLDSGSISNALILKQYAKSVAQQHPDLAELTTALARDADANGPMMQNLQERLEDAKVGLGFSTWQEQVAELNLIAQASSRQLYNDALSDPINVLADLSDGSLKRVNAVSREASLSANNAEDYGPGSQLIGNPQYGAWRTDSRGMSFWEWYGMYALFSNITGGFGYSRPYYHNWSRNRNYSYYHDYGRRNYTSYRNRQKQSSLETRTRKTFASQGKKFQSPYAKSKTGGSALSRTSTVAKSNMGNTSSVFKKSSYAKSSPSSSSSSSSSSKKYSSNFKSGYSRSSRGFSGGK